MDKINYRLVFNRKKKLNRQGKALVQVELYQNGRKVYISTSCLSRKNGTMFHFPCFIVYR